ncbi:MAG: hypothetical protein M1814_005315 [Vezdaea aestivalis]|nr:MAG: hypothetical protein M1814_005315 [Vezdaea aestivalis]
MTDSRARPYHHRAMIPLLTLQYAAALFRFIVCFFNTDLGVGTPVRVFIFSLFTLGFLVYETVCYRISSFQIPPLRYLCINISKTVLWFVDLIMVIVFGGVVTRKSSLGKIILVVSIFIFLTFFAGLIYASMIYHKSKRAPSNRKMDVGVTDPPMNVRHSHSSDPENIPVRMQ